MPGSGLSPRRPAAGNALRPVGQFRRESVLLFRAAITDRLSKNESRRKDVLLPDLTSAAGKHASGLAAAAAAARRSLPGSSAQTTAATPATPALLRGSPREHRRAGLERLAKLHRVNPNGVLADGAGLGKAVQVVAFFAHLACNDSRKYCRSLFCKSLFLTVH